MEETDEKKEEKKETVRQFYSATLAYRSEQALTPRMLVQRNKFIYALLTGMTKKKAAIYAGYSEKGAMQKALELYREPYVQEKLRELREACAEEELLTRKELILNVKAIAFDDDEEGRVRVGASTLLSKMMGWDAPTRTLNAHVVQGGVMIVPAAGDMDNWENVAAATQLRLKGEVRV